ncbi:MAG: hypothetical protein Q7U64_04340 [Desulfocapsaceae bacterium]|nr:hypothetical protein [Desulfocapsaceae bacterium]
MKRVSWIAICVLLSFIWIPLVSAGTNNGSSTQEQQNQVTSSAQNDQLVQPSTRMVIPLRKKGTMPRESQIQSDPIIQPQAGISWKEKVMREREIQKRAAASRNALMREAAIDAQNETQNPVQQASPAMP